MKGGPKCNAAFIRFKMLTTEVNSFAFFFFGIEWGIC